MSDPIEREVQQHGEDSIQREIWGTRLGFILAAVGSAVGLGNMWRFPYRVSEGGGAAFVVLYLVFTLVIGIPLMLSEFAVGRRTRLSPIGALKKEGGGAWTLVGFLGVLTGFLILAFYSVIAGWVLRYAIEGALWGFNTDPGAHFTQVSSGFAPILYHLAFMGITITIVMGGVEKGIEKASLIMMPALFAIVLGLAVWAFSLPGSSEGYTFYLAPSFTELLNPQTFAEAAGQAFFSLSLGMGAMLTFASYLSRHENLNREAATIAAADFGVAFTAGLVVFPVIAALGLQGQVSASTVGALFIALPGGFVEMGMVGRWVGVAFFLALFVGAVTSAVSLL
ncbi:MAG TPA: sodium-dependent transporter, partial [Thioalkalivibrio sp.]|nr:sodium-dependent transporter [Thioalkalivibrio sp.]